MTTAGSAAKPWLIGGAVACVLLYAALVGCLAILGRRERARALAGFVPDCIVLARRLLREPLVPRSRKLLLIALVAYLAMPVDLVPDFVPVAGQLDDAIMVMLVLRSVLRGAGTVLVRRHWPGPASSLAVVLRLAGPDRVVHGTPR
jgi:uncharacterized membrane protein YkvA (DUF1232 family)